MPNKVVHIRTTLLEMVKSRTQIMLRRITCWKCFVSSVWHHHLCVLIMTLRTYLYRRGSTDC